jgi:hypothetical protein
MTLDGYWTAMVQQGGGSIGALQSGDRIAFKPATAADIQKVQQPRTSASSGRDEPKPLKPGKATTDWLAVQRGREQFIS